MKPTPNSHPELAPLLAFGAHPDDIEFGCGGVIALGNSRRTQGAFRRLFARRIRFPRDTRATSGRSEKGRGILGATVEFIELDGDAHLEVRAAHAIKLAGILRRVRPGMVLAPSLVENQHPDHAQAGKLVRDAARLARYGGVEELRKLKAARDWPDLLLRGHAGSRTG